MIRNGKKRCPICNKNKLAEYFYNAPLRGDGKTSFCKLCQIKAARKYRAEHLEEQKSKQREAKRAKAKIKKA